jgi:hypothetical protein
VVVDVADLLVVVLALLYPLVPEPRREKYLFLSGSFTSEKFEPLRL